MKCKRVTNKTASLEFYYISPVYPETPETHYQYVKIVQKGFWYIAFLLVYKHFDLINFDLFLLVFNFVVIGQPRFQKWNIQSVFKWKMV